MKNFFILLTSFVALLLFKPCKTLGQDFACGVILGKEPLKAPGSLPNENYVLNRTISVTAHIVFSKDGDPATTKELIENDIAAGNKFFEEMKLSFKLCSVNYVYNYNYFDLTHPGIDPAPENELKTKYFEPKTLNIYYVNEIATNGRDICGYAYMPSSELDIIVLEGGCLGNGKTFAHEVGHYFGLYHTFEASFGQELPDGSNCTTTGDLICDTPGDKDGIFKINQTSCEIEESESVNGVYYLPLTNNLMSYYLGSCKERFTAGQYKRMAKFYYSHRAVLF